MAEDGRSEEEIAAWREQSEALAAQHGDHEDPFVPWPETEEAIGVLKLCQLEYAGGAAGSFVTGVSTTEIRAVMDTIGIPRERWNEVLARVRFAVAVMVPELNRRRA